MLCRVRARFRVLFAVQRRGESGAPEVVGSTSPSRSRSSVGSLSIVRLRPPPGRRTRPGASRTRVRSSLSPRVIVDVEMPVARATSAMPPRPRARASVAAHTRRDRSVSVGASARYFARQPRRSTHSNLPSGRSHPSFIVLRALSIARARGTSSGSHWRRRRRWRVSDSGTGRDRRTTDSRGHGHCASYVPLHRRVEFRRFLRHGVVSERATAHGACRAPIPAHPEPQTLVTARCPERRPLASSPAAARRPQPLKRPQTRPTFEAKIPSPSR